MHINDNIFLKHFISTFNEKKIFIMTIFYYHYSSLLFIVIIIKSQEFRVIIMSTLLIHFIVKCFYINVLWLIY